MGFVIPTLYALFELRETVIVGVPSEAIMEDKWTVDLKPVIEGSRYRDLLPDIGSGSRGGKALTVQFRNGAILRFMTGGGDDQSRSAYTSRFLRITEVDGFDEVGSSSREGTKFDQLERRTLAFGAAANVIGECTATIETGRIWKEYTNGSRSRIAIPCPHCGEYVTPEREHLVGWQDATSEAQAVASAAIACPSCGAMWSNAQRIEANRRGVLVHRGQEVGKDGVVRGDLPPTRTLGFRWNCVNSIMNQDRLSLVAAKEYAVKHADDQDAAETDLKQSEWAVPAKPPVETASEVNAHRLRSRILANHGPGVCPADTQFVTVGIDVGKWQLHWTAAAWRPGATPHVAEYGIEPVDSHAMAEEEAIKLALRRLIDTFGTRFRRGDAVLKPAFVLIDAGWYQDTILQLTAEYGSDVWPTKGFGESQERLGFGNRKRESGSKVLDIGETDNYSLIQLPGGQKLFEIQVDYWKTWLHKRASTPLDTRGALTLHDAEDHHAYTKQLSAEQALQKFDPKRGTITYWHNKTRRKNHYLDATVLACIGGHMAGARLIDSGMTENYEPAQDAGDDEAPDENFITSYQGRH